MHGIASARLVNMSNLLKLSSLSWISLSVLLVLMGLFALIVLLWQIRILSGHAMKNADGSTDDWHEQKTHYGIAVADVFVACPACLTGIVLVFINPRAGCYLLALVAFWFVWANIMTTATSLKFERPRLSPAWWLAFPTGIFLGLAYIAWTVVNFDILFSQ
jgi:hypothetical protein